MKAMNMPSSSVFFTVRRSPQSLRTKLEAQLDSTAVKSIHNALHVKSEKLILVKFPGPGNQNLSEVMVYMPILCRVDMGQGGSLLFSSYEKTL